MGSRSEIRTIVRGAYAIQKLRIQTGNRLVVNFRAKIGQEPGESEEEMDAEGRKILKNLRLEYDKMTEGVVDAPGRPSFPRKTAFKATGVISSYTELSLIAHYVELESVETTHFRRLRHALEDYPIYTAFLKGVRGVGPVMAGVIVSEFDIYKAEYPSSMWKYAGLDVVNKVDDEGHSVGLARSRRKEHLVEVSYKNAEGEDCVRNSITFNPWLKTKLLGVLAPSFLRARENKYKTEYDNYKNRLANHVSHKDKTPMHRHRMALRYMVKRFLVDLYKAWRELEGLPVAPEYSVAKLGMTHGSADKYKRMMNEKPTTEIESSTSIHP